MLQTWRCMDWIRNLAHAIKIASLVLIGVITAYAIVIPRLVRARINANEAAAIADSHIVISAEQAYASANGGYFDDVTRLCREGPDCQGIGIPSYPENRPGASSQLPVRQGRLRARVDSERRAVADSRRKLSYKRARLLLRIDT